MLAVHAYLGIVLAISILFGSTIAAFTEPRFGVLVGLILYAGALTVGCLIGHLRHVNDLYSAGEMHIHRPSKTMITLRMHFSRDADHRWPVYVEQRS